MREETMTWFTASAEGVRTPHATAAEGHANLMLTMAMDLSRARDARGPAHHPRGTAPAGLAERRRSDSQRRHHRNRVVRRHPGARVAGAPWSSRSTWRRSTPTAWRRSAGRPVPRRRPDWEELVADPAIDAIMVSATPETLHYPMAKAVLESGKHVLLEKPMALTLDEADELIGTGRGAGLKFTIGYSQRFNAKQAMVKRSIDDGTLGQVSSILVSRHITRSLGAKISSRTKLSPAAMEATHDIDFAFWCLEPRRPVRVYSQNAWGVRKPPSACRTPSTSSSRWTTGPS